MTPREARIELNQIENLIRQDEARYTPEQIVYLRSGLEVAYTGEHARILRLALIDIEKENNHEQT